MKSSRSLLQGLALLLSVLSLSTPVLAQSSPRKLFAEAYELQSKGNYSKALQVWNQSIKTDSSEPAAYVNRGITRYYLQDLRGAVEDLSVAIAKKSDYSDAYYNRAAIRSALLDYPGALADYEKYLQIAPASADRVQINSIVTDLRRRVGPTATTPSPASTPAGTTTTASTQRTPPVTSPSTPATASTAIRTTTSAPAARPTTTTTASTPARSSATTLPPIAKTPLPPGTVSLGRINGYDATTEDLLLGLRLTTDRKLLSSSSGVYKTAQNFVAQMKQGSTIDQSLQRSGLDKQTMIRLAWRGAAWRSYKVFIR